MNLAVRIILVAVLLAIPLKGAAQGNAEIVEELKRLAGEIADLREANSAQKRRMTQMQKKSTACARHCANPTSGLSPKWVISRRVRI
jgi:membrane protein insertase Oxa1/YidC/SpoIIIJ